MARKEGISEEKIKFIIGDNDNFEESGEASKIELDNMTTLITKMYKQDGTVHFTKATKWVVLKEDTDSGLTYYPIAHINWEEKEGSARGEGEVRYLTPNQIEVNRTEVRRVLTVKYQAYPQKIADIEKIANPNSLGTVGGIIKVRGGAQVEDVKKILSTLPPAQMSPDVKLLQDDLIQMSRDLAGAGESATGEVDPESASGRAILAVQRASQSIMTEQKESYKNFIEDLAKIWLDMMIVYSSDGLKLEETIKDPNTGEEQTQLVDISQETLRELQASVKVDITPRGALDKYAQEISIENMFKAGMFNAQKLPELKIYVSLLDDESVMPKEKMEEAIRLIEEEQQKIAMMNAQAQLMQQRVNQFLSNDPNAQASQMNEYAKQQQMNNDNQALE